MLDVLIIILIAIVILVLLIVFSAPSLSIAFIKSRQTEYPIPFKILFTLYLRKMNLNKMIEVNNLIHLHNLQLSLNDIEHFWRLGGDVNQLLDEALRYKQNHMDFIFDNYLKSNS